MRGVAALALSLAIASLQPATAAACEVTPWEIRPGESSQSALMRIDQERLTPSLKTNVVLTRVTFAERERSRLRVVFEPIAAVRGAAGSNRLNTELNDFCFPIYPWRVGELAILYLDPEKAPDPALAVPPHQNIDPKVAQDLRILAANLRQSSQ